jgi:hypothetical protein
MRDEKINKLLNRRYFTTVDDIYHFFANYPQYSIQERTLQEGQTIFIFTKGEVSTLKFLKMRESNKPYYLE